VSLSLLPEGRRLGSHNSTMGKNPKIGEFDMGHGLPKRMWVNQPSTLQPFHNLHGTNVLAIPEREGIYRIYFLAGPIIDQELSALCLSDGWNDQETNK
jgi:hypothetical protein